MIRRIRGYDTARGQSGWKCDCAFTVTTADQFTDEEHAVRAYARWMWLAMFRSRIAARRLAVSLAARPGEREARGWA